MSHPQFPFGFQFVSFPVNVLSVGKDTDVLPEALSAERGKNMDVTLTPRPTSPK